MYGRFLLSLVTALAVAVMALPAAALAEGRAVTRTVTVSVLIRVENRSQELSRNLMVVVPPMVQSEAGTQRVLAAEMVTAPASTRETPVGLEATYRYAQVEPGATFTIEQRYTVELSDTPVVMLEEEAVAGQLTSPAAGIESDDVAIRAQAESVTDGLTDPDAKAEAIMRYVVNHLSYDLKSPSRNQGALSALTSGSGVCTEYAGLFVAMARASGVPARMVYGWAGANLNGELNGTNRHAWAEYYSPERGWVPVDPTFAEALPADKIMYFDGINHIAQDYRQTNPSSSYSGRGILSIKHQVSVSGQTVAVASPSR